MAERAQHQLDRLLPVTGRPAGNERFFISSGDFKTKPPAGAERNAIGGALRTSGSKRGGRSSDGRFLKTTFVIIIIII